MRVGVTDTNNPGLVSPHAKWFDSQIAASKWWTGELGKEGYWDQSGRGGCTEDHYRYLNSELVTMSILEKDDVLDDVKIRMLREVWLGEEFNP